VSEVVISLTEIFIPYLREAGCGLSETYWVIKEEGCSGCGSGVQWVRVRGAVGAGPGGSPSGTLGCCERQNFCPNWKFIEAGSPVQHLVTIH